MMRLPQTLLGRNVLVLVASLIIFQVLFFGALVGFVLLPQSQRIAGIVADSIAAVSNTMDALPPELQAGLIAELDRSDFLDILPDSAKPPDTGSRPRMLERIFMQALIDRLEGQDELTWRMGRDGIVWVHIKLGPDFYWIAARAPRAAEPLMVTALSLIGLSVIVGLFGFALSSQVARPLADLQMAADRVSLGQKADALELSGPAEIDALAASFNRMTGRLEAAERERAIVLAGVSHDLRTPMAKLRLVLEMLPATDLEARETITRQISRMDRLLRQFLDYARGFDSEAQQTRRLASAVQEAAAEAGVAALIKIPETAEAAIRPGAFRRALVNLFENAAAHGAAPITAEYRTEPGWHILAIRDAGPGAPPDVLEALKEPFRRGDQAQRVSGSGLGLAIVDRIAAAHGGRLALASSDNGFEAALWIAA